MFCMFQGHGVEADLLGQGADEEGFASAGRPTRMTPCGMSRRRSHDRPDDLGLRPLLELIHAADDFEAGCGVDHFEQAGVFLGNRAVFGADQVAVRRPASDGLEQDVLDVDQAQAGGDVGEFIRSEIGWRRLRFEVPLDESAPTTRSGSGTSMA